MSSSLIKLVFRSLPLVALVVGCASADPNSPETGDPGSDGRGPLGKADSSGSCVDRCGGQSDGTCWCDAQCAQYGDCCDDIETACGTSSGATITFGEDFSESVSGPLTKGQTVKIDYDEDRLTQCRGTQGGYLQWTITGYYKIDGGPTKTFAVAGNMAPQKPELPKIELYARGELELWFQNNNKWGCNAYDSNYGNNYVFEVK